ncbi:hypothetical protein [Adlercreutzia equolifaciens]|uniref:hypothetical protein n=1 Tax=Adlercreutzia equolifaciens TaxID=446660 RepID=UPI001CC5FAE8|nr:hypothetical protein [Adlercreutzia equolifaciens]GJC75293.1 hypothetical protein Aeq9CBH6_06280 [Adlercreutzia equolifaciens]
MATLDELMAQDAASDGVWEVSALTREVSAPPGIGLLGVSSDELVRPIKFSVPRYYHGTDLSGFSARINYRNALGEDGMALAEGVKTTDEAIELTWTLPRHALAAAGEARFSLCFVKLAADGATVEQEFNTVPMAFTVAEGLETDMAEVEGRLDWIWKIVDDCADARDAAQAASAALAGAADAVEKIGGIRPATADEAAAAVAGAYAQEEV